MNLEEVDKETLIEIIDDFYKNIIEWDSLSAKMLVHLRNKDALNDDLIEEANDCYDKFADICSLLRKEINEVGDE